MKRIETLASLVDKDAYVLDIGTDHAYLPIYLYKNNITLEIVRAKRRQFKSFSLEYHSK